MLRLASESSLKLEEITKDENGWTSWVMDLLDGFVRGQVRSNEQGSTAKMKLKISSPLAQMGVRGTEFTFGIEGETSILETHSGEVLLGSKTTSLEKNEGIERVRSGQISSLSRGQARPKPAVASASGRRQHQNMNQFFQRSRELAERPILLKARFQDLRDVERKQLRENFQRARPNFVPSVRKPEVLLNRPAMPQGNSQLRPRQTTLPMPPVAQGRATRSPAPMPTANRAGVMRPAMPANSGAAMPAPMPANGRGTRPQR
jgi:hypothetical protein